MCSTEKHGQQCTRADQLSDMQFRQGLARWAAVNVSFILYTSIMHCGHSPIWENGTLSKQHPEYSERDENGACPGNYGHCNLSPEGQSVQATLNYTLRLRAEHPSVNAFMIDNALWQAGPTGLPTGFSAAARGQFRHYVQARFGSSARNFLGVNASMVEPPTASQRNESSPSPIFGVWKLARARAYGAAVEHFRGRLHEYGVSLLANTVFWPLRWADGTSEVVQHVDGVISESHHSSAADMSLKEEYGRSLSLGAPQLNYIAIFSQSCQIHYEGAKCALRNVSVVRGMMVASMLHAARPWLVAWGLSALIDAATGPVQAASELEASRLMLFRAKHFDSFYDGLQKAAVVGVLASWRQNDQPARPTQALRALGVPYRIETEPSISNGSLAAHATCPLTLLLCDGMETLEQAASAAIVRWVQDGGTLVIRKNQCALMDEAGRRYPQPLLEAAFAQGDVGRGRVVLVNGSLTANDTAVEAMRAAATTVLTPRTPGHPKTTSWEFVPWSTPALHATPPRMVIHFSNATEAGGASKFGKLDLQIALSAPLVPVGKLKAMLFSPYETSSRMVGATRQATPHGVLAVLSVPNPPWYGVIELGPG